MSKDQKNQPWPSWLKRGLYSVNTRERQGGRWTIKFIFCVAEGS